MRMFFFFFKIY